LQWLAGVHELGVYAVGFNLGLVLSLFVSAFQTAWLPYFMSYAEKPEEAATLFGRVMTYYAFGFGALTLIFFISAKPLVMLMTQPPYFEAYKVVGFSATAQFLFGAFYILLPSIYFAGHVRYLGLIQAPAALVSVGLNLLLIWVFGFAGAAPALALGASALVLLTYAWNRVHRREYLVVKYEWRRLGLFLVVFLAYAMIAMWHRSLPLGAEIGFCSVLAASLPFVIYGLLVGDERKRVRSMLRGLPWRSAGTPPS
jgi:O-antigen/teichoic acid export membrane protein